MIPTAASRGGNPANRQPTSWSPVRYHQVIEPSSSKERLSASTQDLRNGNMLKYAGEYPEQTPTKNHHLDHGNSAIDEGDLVRFNVCGMVYEILRSTLARFPSTLLGDQKRLAPHYIKSRNCYYFECSRHSFEAILFYYQTKGVLIRPQMVPMKIFLEEVVFFDLGKETFMKLQAEEGYIPDQERETPDNPLQRTVWELFEFPDSSQPARILASWSVTIIVLSITIFCLETLPQYAPQPHDKANFTGNSTNGTTGSAGRQYNQPWFSLELGCIIWFTFEYIVRLISCPSKWKFVRSFLNIIDLLAILPYFITMSVNSENTTPLSVLRVVRLVRVFRIFKLSRHSLGLRILGHTLRASISELGMLMFFLFLGVILFSSAIFYAEQGQNDDFTSIPDAFWYSLVTMTTVGYGDKTPITLIGKFIGSLCAIVGVLTIALPVPVIVSNFEFFYKRDRIALEQNKYQKDKDKLQASTENLQKPLSDENHDTNVNHTTAC